MRQSIILSAILAMVLVLNRLLPCLLCLLTACAPSPRQVIFDTDWWTDVDDVCAVRALLQAEREGKVAVEGICLSAVDSLSVASLSSFLDYEGRKGVFLGADKAASDYSGTPSWHGVLAEGHPQREANTLDDVEDAATFYRTILAKAKKPLDIIAVGYPNALALLLQSGPDAISPLSGEELLRRKVRHLWMMAGQYPEGRENNFIRSGRSLKAGSVICTQWPTEITFLGYEVGIKVKAGGKLPEDDLLHKVLAAHGSADGRYAWDPLLTWLACLDNLEEAGFDAVRGTVILDTLTGVDRFVPSPDGRHRYVSMVHDPEWYVSMLRPVLRETE